MKQLEDYKCTISELETKEANLNISKNEAAKWKQSYERLAITLKNSQGSDSKEMESLIEDYQQIQNKLEDMKVEKEENMKEIVDKDNNINNLQKIITQNGEEIKILKDELEELKSEAETEGKLINTQNSTLILRLEKNIKKLEGENAELKNALENSRKTNENLNEKYQLSVEKSLKHDQLQHCVDKLQKENNSLNDQLKIFKKTNSEQKKLLASKESNEMLTTINSLKSTIQNKEGIIQEQKAQLEVLQNLLDEARVEMGSGDTISEKSEKASFTDALEILDSIISKPLGISSTNKSQDFNAILKRAQLLKEQTEEPIIRKMVEFMSKYLPQSFCEQEKECPKINDLKQLFLEHLITLKEQNRVILDQNSEALNVSTDSKNMRRPYGYKDAYIDSLYIFDQFTETYSIIREAEFNKNVDKTVSEIEQKYNQKLIDMGNEYIEKLQSERTQLVSQMNAEKETELKIKEDKISRNFEAKRREMYEQFEILKKEFHDQFTDQSKKYQKISEQENDKQREEIEEQKEIYEQEFQEKLLKKTNLLEGIFKNRKNELEDEYNLKMKTLEFEMKSQVENHDNKNKAELESLVNRYEIQAQDKIKRIQSE